MAKKAVFLALTLIVVLAFAPPEGAAQPERYEKYGGPPPGRPAPQPPPPRYSPAPPRHAPHGQTYFYGSLGIFDPNDDVGDGVGESGLSGYDSGLSGNLAIGSRLSPIWAIEGGVGFFSADVGPNELTVVPVTFGARFIIPHPFIEPYFGAGLGFYLADIQEPPDTAPFFYEGTDDSDTTIGGYFSLGLDLWLNQRAALNLEGRYQIAEPSFTTNLGQPLDVDVSGWTLNMGVRLSF